MFSDQYKISILADEKSTTQIHFFKTQMSTIQLHAKHATTKSTLNIESIEAYHQTFKHFICKCKCILMNAKGTLYPERRRSSQ